MAHMQQGHSQQVWRHDVYVKTRKFLLLLFCIWTSYLSSSDCFVVILKFYTVLMFLHAVRKFVCPKAFSSKHVSTFYRENMTSFFNFVTATLRALFAWRGSFVILQNIAEQDRNAIIMQYFKNINNKINCFCFTCSYTGDLYSSWNIIKNLV